MNFYVANEEGRKFVKLDLTIDLGEIKKPKPNTILIQNNVEAMMLIVKEAIKQAVKNNDRELLDSQLEEFSKLWMNNQLGIVSFPLREKNGIIEGLKEGITVEVGD